MDDQALIHLNQATQRLDLRRVFFVGLAIWSLLGFFDANQTYFLMLNQGMHHSWLRIAVWAMTSWNFWAIMTPFIFWLERVFPLDRAPVKSLLLHVSSAIASSATHVLLIVSLGRAIRPFDDMTKNTSFADNYINACIGMVPFGLFVYGAVIATAYALDFRQQFRERQIRTAQLESLLTQARLRSITSQLRPHFLFNTLNGIMALIRTNDNEAAGRMLVGLSNMLRSSLVDSPNHTTTLSAELEFTKLYTGIEEQRFGDRLSVLYDVPKDLLGVTVPSLILQPLVENAVQHGIAPRAAAGHIWIRARCESNLLIVEVQDDGIGLRDCANRRESSGLGLSATRERLAYLYGSNQSLEVGNAPKGGTLVTIRLPLQAITKEASP